MVRKYRTFFIGGGIKINRFEQARNFNIYNLLNNLGIEYKAKNNTTFYRCVNPMHEDRHPSMSVRNNRFKCFACGVGGSTIDLVKYVLNLNDIEAVNYILSLDTSKINAYTNIKNKNLEKKKDVDDKIKYMILKNSKSDEKILDSYFLFRGLKDIYKKVDKEQIEILSNTYKGRNSIIYNFPKHNFFIQKTIGEKGVFVHGHSTFVTYRGYKHNKFAIVEGIEDGLSALMLGYNFICLNSVSNLDKLLEAMLKYKEKLQDNVYYMALDNDLAGIKANKRLKTFLKEHNFKYSTDLFMLYYRNKVKDLNDYTKGEK